MNRSLIFERGGLRFALRLHHVRRICGYREIRPLPSASEGVIGVVPDGINIVPVIETPLPPFNACGIARVVLVNNDDSPFGFMVESLAGPASLRHEGEPEIASGLRSRLPPDFPPAAIIGILRTLVHVQGIFPTDPLLDVVPGPLYRARTSPEDT